MIFSNCGMNSIREIYIEDIIGSNYDLCVVRYLYKPKSLDDLSCLGVIRILWIIKVLNFFFF